MTVTDVRRPTGPGGADVERGSRRRRPPWSFLVALAATVAFAVLRPGPFRAAVTEPVALVRIALVVGALVAWSYLLRRIVGAAALRAVLVALPVALVVWVAVLPYFRSSRVDEALPGLDVVADGGGATVGPSSTSTTATVPLAAPVAEAPAPGSPAPGAAAPDAQAPSTTLAAPVTTVPVPSSPVLLGSAPLAGIDHRASGTAALYRLPDGALVVRLEDIDIESGPDYDLYVVGGSDHAQPGGGARLDDLRANEGSHNYPVADDVGVDLATSFTVLVWCEAFAVPVANATIAPAS